MTDDALNAALAKIDERCRLVVNLHQKVVGDYGETDGSCAECSCIWPCSTFHILSGWGLIDACGDEGWCSHAGVPLR